MSSHSPDSDGKTPLEALVDEVSSKQETSAEAWAAFTEQEFEPVDIADIWTDVPTLTEDAEPQEPGASSPDGTTDTVESDDAVISKRSYCMRCRFFETPPTVRCTADDSRIVEFVSMSDIRVQGCPVVEGRHDLFNQ